MSSKTKKQRNAAPHATSAARAPETQGADSERHQKIRIRAYEIYLERGQQHGRDLGDWLEAEQELEAKVRSARAGQ